MAKAFRGRRPVGKRQQVARLEVAVHHVSVDEFQPGRQLFLSGWLTGLGLFASGVTWIYVSISEHGNTSIPVAVLLMTLFVAGLALVHGIAFWGWGKLAKETGKARGGGGCSRR